MKRSTFPKVASFVALGLVLGHLTATRGDHAQLDHLSRQLDSSSTQLAQLRSDVRELGERAAARDARQDAQLTAQTERLSRAERLAAAARASRSRRAALTPYAPAGAAQWASSRDAVRVANCESGDLPRWPYSDGTVDLSRPTLRDPNGHDGKWQFAPPTWRSVGGSGRAYDAPEAEQDYRAWLLWKRDGWQPWTCARKLGIT